MTYFEIFGIVVLFLLMGVSVGMGVHTVFLSPSTIINKEINRRKKKMKNWACDTCLSKEVRAGRVRPLCKIYPSTGLATTDAPMMLDSICPRCVEKDTIYMNPDLTRKNNESNMS